MSFSDSDLLKLCELDDVMVDDMEIVAEVEVVSVEELDFLLLLLLF